MDKENREIAAFIENKDKWKVEVKFLIAYDCISFLVHIWSIMYSLYSLFLQVEEQAKERRAIKVRFGWNYWMDFTYHLKLIQLKRVRMKRIIIQICFLSKNQEVLKLGEEIEARRREEDERRALMHELHEGRVKELEEKVKVFISKV